MTYYLQRYLGGMDWWQAYGRFDMDFAIYTGPSYTYDPKGLSQRVEKRLDLGTDKDGNHRERIEITTPKGTLSKEVATTDVTAYDTEHLLKSLRDFEIWNELYPVPTGIDFTHVHATKDRLGDRGIIRAHPFSPGQGSPWQSFCGGLMPMLDFVVESGAEAFTIALRDGTPVAYQRLSAQQRLRIVRPCRDIPGPSLRTVQTVFADVAVPAPGYTTLVYKPVAGGRQSLLCRRGWLAMVAAAVLQRWVCGCAVTAWRCC